MLNMLLGIVGNADGNYYFDNKAESLIYALIGFLVVIAGICILIGIIWLLGLLMRKTNNLAFLTERKSRKQAGKKAENQAKQEQNAESTEKLAEDSALEDDIPDEVKAAIIAAIMAYYSEQENKCEFTVKRIKRL